MNPLKRPSESSAQEDAGVHKRQKRECQDFTPRRFCTFVKQSCHYIYFFMKHYYTYSGEQSIM